MPDDSNPTRAVVSAGPASPGRAIDQAANLANPLARAAAGQSRPTIVPSCGRCVPMASFGYAVPVARRSRVTTSQSACCNSAPPEGCSCAFDCPSGCRRIASFGAAARGRLRAQPASIPVRDRRQISSTCRVRTRASTWRFSGVRFGKLPEHPFVEHFGHHLRFALPVLAVVGQLAAREDFSASAAANCGSVTKSRAACRRESSGSFPGLRRAIGGSGIGEPSPSPLRCSVIQPYIASRIAGCSRAASRRSACLSFSGLPVELEDRSGRARATSSPRRPRTETRPCVALMTISAARRDESPARPTPR